MIRNVTAAQAADAGMVSIHAQTIFLAVIQRTLAPCSTLPTPIMEPAMTCVVETGIPKCAVVKSTAADAVSAQIPSFACIFVILVPIVLTIRHPPNIVPIDIAI